MSKKGIAYTVGSALLFGFIPLITAVVYQQGIGAMTVAFFRSFIVMCVLFVLLRIRKVSLRLDSYQIKQILKISCFGTGATIILLNYSYLFIDTGTATSLHFLYPIFVALLCRWMYQERLNRQKLIALGWAFIAIVCFILDHFEASILGYTFAILSGLTYAYYMVKVEKTGLVHIDAMKLSFYLSMVVSILCFILQFFIEPIQYIVSIKIYVLLIIIALSSSFLAVIFLQKGIQYLGSTNASIFCLFEPIVSLLCGVLFLNEELSIFKTLGCLCIICSLLIFIYADKKVRDE